MSAQIFVVEDDRNIQELIAVNLSRAGHRVQLAENGEHAVDLLRTSIPDLMLIDWMLPGLSGVDLARQLR